MNQIKLLAYAPKKRDAELLKDALIRYAVKSDNEISIDWVRVQADENEVASAAAEKQLAFIYAGDTADAARIGGALAHSNPDCLLAYFGPCPKSERPDVIGYFQTLFPSRPVRYAETLKNAEVEDILLECVLRSEENLVFVRETKGVVYRLPYRDIAYFRSDRNYISVCMKNKSEHLFIGKLSDIERSLEQGFFRRIHQSYLVNADAVVMINKSKKSVVLSNGEEIFVSRSHYKDVFL